MTRTFILCILLSLPAAVVHSGSRPPHEETLRDRRGFHLFGGPSREGPEAQWERVEGYVEANRQRRAIRHAGYLVNTWPDSPRAVDAQRLIGDLHFARQNYVEAFEAYQELVDNYAGEFDYDELITQQLETAYRAQNKDYSGFFGLTTFQQPLKAIPLYEQLLVNAPTHSEAPRIRYEMGRIYLGRRKYMDAVREFQLLVERHPLHPLAEDGLWLTAEAYRKRAERTPTDIQPREGEFQALRQFTLRFPESERIGEAREHLQASTNKLAELRYQQGVFYEEKMRRPRAALRMYESLIQQFPDSEWTGNARERILRLNEIDL